jgi:signal transduction histidine kinase
MSSPRASAPIRPTARDTWLILGSRYALTYPVFALYAIPVVLSTVLLAQTAPRQTGVGQWILLAVIAWAAPVLTLILARITLLPNKPRSSKPTLTLVAFFIAGFVRALAFSAVERALGVSDLETLFLRLSGGTLTIGISFGLIAILVASRFEYRDEVRRLEADRARLQELETGISAEIARERPDVLAVAQNSLTPIIDRLKESIAEIHDPRTASAVSEQMRDTVDAVVRPLSVQISQRPILDRNNAGSNAWTRHPRVRPEQRLGLGYFFLPFTFSLFVVSMTGASVLFVAGLAEGIRTLQVMFILLMTMLWIFRIATFRIRLSPALGALVYMLLHIVAAWSITEFIQYIGTSIPRDLLNGWIILVAALAILGYRYQLVDHERRIILASLTEVNERLEILMSSLRQQSKVDARRVANILHGPVQTALYASAMRISQTEDLAPGTIERVLEDLDSAMSKLIEGEHEAPELGAFIDELRTVWGPKVEIDYVPDDVATAALDANPVAQSCAIEVVREGVNNAIKHGGASHIVIEVFKVESMLIDVTVSNNAPLRQANASPGFGSSVLDDLTHDWHLTWLDGRTTLWASVALDNLS